MDMGWEWYTVMKEFGFTGNSHIMVLQPLNLLKVPYQQQASNAPIPRRCMRPDPGRNVQPTPMTTGSVSPRHIANPGPLSQCMNFLSTAFRGFFQHRHRLEIASGLFLCLYSVGCESHSVASVPWLNECGTQSQVFNNKCCIYKFIICKYSAGFF